VAFLCARTLGDAYRLLSWNYLVLIVRSHSQWTIREKAAAGGCRRLLTIDSWLPPNLPRFMLIYLRV